jgi:hypothetical protein
MTLPAPDSPASASDRRVRRILGHLVSLTGTHGVIACEMNGSEPGDYWSVGNLISVVHDGARMVGQVCDITVPDNRWRPNDVNTALVRIELCGEIVDQESGAPKFFRGIHAFPTLGSVAHRIRAGDLKAIFSVENARVVEIGVLSQNPTISAMVSVDELTRRHFAIVGSNACASSPSCA